MDFASAIVFQFLYFVRPQDWIGFLGNAKLITLTMAWALLATFARPKGLSTRDFLRTPHDWAMVAYFVWVLYAAVDAYATFQEIKSLWIFYFVTLLALSSVARLSGYLKWWTIMLVILAALAVGSQHGIDLTGARAKTEAMGGRLVINTWMHDNPNALGHSVVVAIPLAYFLWIWKRPFGSRVLGLVIISVAAYCVYLTQSKGSFLVGFGTVAVSQMLGRPKIVQITVLAIALTIGVTAMVYLPRMEKLSRSEEGIQGRLLAWEMARTAMQDNPKGKGWDNFIAVIKWQKQWIEKATHSSYIQIGAALGYTGLFLYVGILYCGLRTVLQTRTEDEEQERARRMLFSLIFSFACSNWMIDRAYHTEFFLLTAAIGAFHRLTTSSSESDAQNDASVSPAGTMFEPQPAFAYAGGGVDQNLNTNSGISAWSPKAYDSTSMLRGETMEGAGQVPQVEKTVANRWNRIGLLDIVCTGVLFWGVLQIWNQVLKGG